MAYLLEAVILIKQALLLFLLSEVHVTISVNIYLY